MPAAVAAWTAALMLTGTPEAAVPAVWLGLSGAVAAVLTALWGPRSRRDLLAACALVGVAIAAPAVAVSMHAEVRSPSALAEARGTFAVELAVTERAEAGAARLRGVASRFVPTSGSGGLPEGAAIRAESPVLILDPELSSPVEIGARVRVEGRVSRLPAGETLAALVYADESPVELIEPPPAWLAWGGALRERFRGLASALPGDGGSLLTGLAIGDDSLASADLVEAMRASSLTHLTAVSGANCAIVIAAVFLVGVALRVPRRLRFVIALIALLAFVVLVTPQPSVVRAAVMATIALIGLANSRPASGMPLLCLATIGIVSVDPWAGREFGFILSVLATAGLLILAAPLGRILERGLPRPLALAIAVPAAAQIACQAAIVLLDPAIPTYGVVANLLAAPAAPLATMAGLLACLAAPVLPPLATLLAWIGWLPSAWIASIATTVEQLPGARIPLPDGGAGAVLVVVVTAAVGVAILGRGRARRLAAGIAIGLVALQGAVSIGGRIAGVIDRPGDWQVAMCDVGQGDAVVLRSRGEIALVDTGPDPTLVGACLDELGVHRIDLLVLTHFDHDHVGGAASLAGRVSRVIHGPVDAGASKLLDALRGGGAHVEEVSRGVSGTLGAHTWVVLWPGTRAGVDPGNDASLVLRLSGASARSDVGVASPCGRGICLDAVLLGDLGASAQAALLRAGSIGPASIVKVSHHGSADQEPRLYRALRPRVGLIGVGSDNAYGHPASRSLTMLSDVGATIARSDADGLVLLSARGDEIVVWRERASD